MRHLLLTVALAWFLLGIVACSDGNDAMDDAHTHYIVDVVTYVGSDASTGNACFELVGRDVSGSVMLQGNVPVPEGTKNLQRMLLRYTPAEDGMQHQASRRVTVHSMSNVITDSLRFSTAPLDLYAMHPVKMRSAWRTGDFINLHCQVEYTGKARTMMMLIDDHTRNQDTVHCHLHHDLRTDTAYFWRECYASFNVGNVWKRTQCKTLRLHVNDDEQGIKHYDFDRK